MALNIIEVIKSKKKSIKDSFFYFGSSIVALLLSIFTTPIFAKYFSYSDFAIFNYFSNFAGFFTFFFSLQFYNFYIAEYYRNSDESNLENASKLVSFLLIWNLMLLLIAWQVSLFFLKRMGLSFPTNPFLLLALVIVCCGTFKNFWLIEKRLKRDSLNYFLISGISRVLAVIVSLAFVVFYQNGAKNRLLGTMLVELMFAALSIYFLTRKRKFVIDITYIRKGMIFCFPLILAGIIYYPIIGLDQFFLERNNNIKEIAMYSLGLNFAGYLHTFNYSIFQAIEPDIIRDCVNKEYASLRGKVIGLIGIALTSCLIFNCLSKPIIKYLTHDKYTGAYLYANILVYSYLLVLVYSIILSILNASNRPKVIFTINAIGGVLSIALYFYSSRYYGAIGVAYSRIILFAVISLSGIILFRKYYRT